MKNPNAHRFKYCPCCGENHLAASSGKSFSCPGCGFTFYLNTAAAGIALIFNDTGKLLVTQRRFPPAAGMLDFPGGFVEPGETIEASLIREIKEELNLEISGLTYFCSVPNTYLYRDVVYDITDFAFFCQVNDVGPITACDDVSDFYFMAPTRLDPDRFGLDSPKIIIDRLKKMK